MKNKEHLTEISIIKNGTENEVKEWIEMKTVNDILNKKDRKKMFKEFAKMNEMCVLYKKSADKLIKRDSKSTIDSFDWCND
jgi:NAD(P)H-hydrate repair Nnr-like enzyme with NAD(P)H-hydrate dehydratase domain